MSSADRLERTVLLIFGFAHNLQSSHCAEERVMTLNCTKSKSDVPHSIHIKQIAKDKDTRTYFHMPCHMQTEIMTVWAVWFTDLSFCT